MSSYLVAFLVSEFIPISAAPGLSKVQFKIWARAEANNQTELIFYLKNKKVINCYSFYYA